MALNVIEAPVDTTALTQKQLEDLATEFLRDSGFTWAGRDRATVCVRQCRFERRMPTQCNFGYSRHRR